MTFFQFVIKYHHLGLNAESEVPAGFTKGEAEMERIVTVVFKGDEKLPATLSGHCMTIREVIEENFGFSVGEGTVSRNGDPTSPHEVVLPGDTIILPDTNAPERVAQFDE